jgi:cation diffusion facilitator family transporter
MNSKMQPAGEPGADALSAAVRRVTWSGLFLNIALAAVKMAAGILGSSQALVADSIHSISDCSTDLTILIGVQYWSKPPDESHPYGHRRIETMVTITIGVVLALVACGLGYNAMHTFGERHEAPPGLIALVAALISVATKEWLFRWTAATGRQHRSTALVANAWHHRSDALSSIPVVIAVGTSLLFPQLVWLDHLGAIVVSIFILYAAWGILRPAVMELTDASASRKVRGEIHDLASAVDGVLDVHALRTRTHAGVTQVDMHILVDPEITVHAGHAIADLVKRAVEAGIQDVEDVLVHVEPYEESHED